MKHLNDYVNLGLKLSFFFSGKLATLKLSPSKSNVGKYELVLNTVKYGKYWLFQSMRLPNSGFLVYTIPNSSE